MTCPSCCAACFSSTPQHSDASTSPFALRHLLQAGVVKLDVGQDCLCGICDHVHAEDGWHIFQPRALIPRLKNSEDIVLCGELDFLVKKDYIAITCSAIEDGLLLRIYLVPYDLEGARGQLLNVNEKVLSLSRRYLRRLVPMIIWDSAMWNGEGSSSGKPLLSDAIDTRTLAEIYGDLRSPQVTPVEGLGNISARLLDFGDVLEGLGMRSTLYNYQRRSVSAMLQKELDTRDVPNPLYIPLHTIDNQAFYLQPGTMEIRRVRPTVQPCKGGILCEELGTGKTVMMLTLIVATRSQISSPEPTMTQHSRHIMTPLALRHFPSEMFAETRTQFFRGPDPCKRHVPSLVELMIHQARVLPNCEIPNDFASKRFARNMEMEDQIEAMPLANIIRANAPFYHHYLGEPVDRQRDQRKRIQPGPRIMYLTSATLVVVPANLLSQWDREITKHCDIPLRVLILRAKTRMPAVRRLATDYDIILMTYTRFSAESASHDVSNLHTWTPCTCPEFPGYRVPDCSCQPSGCSPFLQIRWKRLVIDEGHVSASQSTALVEFAKMLSVERRWIVTGTPTTNLLGLSLGSKSIESVNIEEKLQTEIQPSSGESSQSQTSVRSNEPPHIPKRIWTKYDREDLGKLGNMITHFIAVPQFRADTKLVSTHITEPLLDPSGPRRGAVEVLKQVMESVMIRHRIEDVEKDIVLPPVSIENVLLDLDPFVVKSFNALQAIIAVNAIDSQRIDQDYMFHPRNADSLQETLKNMSQILFWHVDEGLYNSRDLLRDAETHIERAVKREMHQEDINLLKAAFFHLQRALDDPVWRAIQTHEDVPFRVSHMPARILDAWTRTHGRESDVDGLPMPEQSGLLHADRLIKLYDKILRHPMVSEEVLIRIGKQVEQDDQLIRRAYEESLKRKKGGSRNGGGKFAKDDASSSGLMVDASTKKASAAETLKEIQNELTATLARMKKEEEELENEGFAAGITNSHHSVPSSPASASQRRRPSVLAKNSPLAKMRVGSSASTKLNYIIDEVQKYSATEKFLIFSESPLSLAHVAEALELIQVRFLRFTTQVTPQHREQLVLTFETSETYRVFLMELKHGARGLNLISASRVIFCEPVWQADVESQAIKRAHRIGQTRPITVKTLAIRETAEENMVIRRAALRNTQGKIPKMLEEAGMRHYIANPKFITQPPTITPSIEFPFIDLPPDVMAEIMQPSRSPQRLTIRIPPRAPLHSSPLKRVRLGDPIISPTLPISHPPFPHSQSSSEALEPAPKKRKTVVRFVSPIA